MSVSNKPINLCSESPHCADVCVLYGVCGLRLQHFLSSAHVFLASLLNYQFFSHQPSDMFLYPSVAPIRSASLNPGASLLFSGNSTPLHAGHKMAELAISCLQSTSTAHVHQAMNLLLSSELAEQQHLVTSKNNQNGLFSGAFS